VAVLVAVAVAVLVAVLVAVAVGVGDGTRQGPWDKLNWPVQESLILAVASTTVRLRLPE
jgi:hypothetical protein